MRFLLCSLVLISSQILAADKPQFSAQYIGDLRQIVIDLYQAGDEGITDLKAFRPLMEDKVSAEVWTQLKRKGYRVIGRFLPEPDSKDKTLQAYAVNDFRQKVIILNMDPKVFGQKDPSFVLVNELWDLDFLHRCIDTEQTPSPYTQDFQKAFNTFFDTNKDLRHLVPLDMKARSKFSRDQVMALWREKRSFLAQWDWYLRTVKIFPDIRRAGISEIAGASDEKKREYLIKHFAGPPYLVEKKLAERLWDHPLPENLNRKLE